MNNPRRNLISPTKQRITPSSPSKRLHRNDSTGVEAALKFTQSPTKAGGSRGAQRNTLFTQLPMIDQPRGGVLGGGNHNGLFGTGSSPSAHQANQHHHQDITKSMFDARVLSSAGVSATRPVHLSAGAGSVQGRRPTMEDTHCIHLGRPSAGAVVGLCAVFDGHCGRDVADTACRLFPDQIFNHNCFGNDNVRALVEGLIDTDKATFRIVSTEGGATHISSLVFNNMLFVIGLGDARAVLCDKGQAIAMSRDHKPSDPDERRRVTAAGGSVQWDRVGGCLAVSRALGDWEFKFSGRTYPDHHNFPVSNIGEVSQINITDTTEFLILACDGLWDVVSNEEAVRFVSDALKKSKIPSDLTQKNRLLSTVAQNLAMYALEKRSMDNVTVVIEMFH
eukprot:PhM_4_TR5944/c0_g1_i1/m.1077